MWDGWERRVEGVGGEEGRWNGVGGGGDEEGQGIVIGGHERQVHVFV